MGAATLDVPVTDVTNGKLSNGKDGKKNTDVLMDVDDKLMNGNGKMTDGPVDAAALPQRAARKPRAPRSPRNGESNESTLESGEKAPRPRNNRERKNGESNGGESNGRSKRSPREKKEELEELPKRTLWVVKVPRPEQDEQAQAVATMEEQLAGFSEKIDKIQETFVAKQEERSAAREQTAIVRDRLREVSSEVREKFSVLKPLQDRMKEINDGARAVKDMQYNLKCTSEEQLDNTINTLESRLESEYELSVIDQKAILRQIKTLKASREDIKAYDTRKAAVAESKMDKEELGERIKFLKGEVEILKAQEDVQKKIFDHYRNAEKTADEAVKEAQGKRVGLIKERSKVSSDLRTARKSLQANKGEFWRTRRTVGKARDFIKEGNIAEAEALCLEQMEHMHARLNKDADYRVEFFALLKKQNDERAAARAEAKAEAEREAAAALAEIEKKLAEEKKLKEEEEKAMKAAQKLADKEQRLQEKLEEKEKSAKEKAEAEKLAKIRAEKEAAAAAAAAKKKKEQEEARKAMKTNRTAAEAPDIGKGKIAEAMSQYEQMRSTGEFTGAAASAASASAAASSAAAAAAAVGMVGETEDDREKREARERTMQGVREAEERKRRTAERAASKKEAAMKAAEARKAEQAKIRAAPAPLAAAPAEFNDAAPAAALDADAPAAAAAAMVSPNKMPRKSMMRKGAKTKWWQDEKIGYAAVIGTCLLLLIMVIMSMYN